jgi:hypothetical protein
MIRMPPIIPLKATARGMDRMDLKKLPKAALLGNPRNRLWLVMYNPLARAMMV